MLKKICAMALSLFAVLLVLINITNGKSGVPLSQDISTYFPRIVGGEEVAEGTAPHMAAIVITEVVTMLFCGGAIISQRDVLTAAHCIDDHFVNDGKLIETYHVIVGTNNWDQTSRRGRNVNISEFFIHPLWDPERIKNDLAILRLDKLLVFSESVGLVAINFNWIGGGETALVTGWGRLREGGITPFRLQMLSVITLSSEECATRMVGSHSVWGNNLTVQADVEICTFHSSERGLCYHDSGSPLMVGGELVGVASWGVPCARGFPDVCTRVSGLEDFVRPVLEATTGAQANNKASLLALSSIAALYCVLN